MKYRNLTLSIVAAFGMGMAGSGIAGSDHGHSSSNATSSGATASSASVGYGPESHAGYDSRSGSSDSSAAIEQHGGPESLASESMSASRPSGSSAQASAQGSELDVNVNEPSLLFSNGEWYSYNDGEWYALDAGEWYVVPESGVSASDSGSSASLNAEASQFEPGWYTDGAGYKVTLYSTDGERWYSVAGEELVAWEPVQVIDDPTLWSPSASLGDSGSYGDSPSESGS